MNRFRIVRFNNRISPAESKSPDRVDFFNSRLFHTLYKFQKTILSFTQNRVIDFRKVREQMFPQEGCSNSAKNNFYFWKQTLCGSCDFYPAPSICMQNGKPYYIRFLVRNVSSIFSGVLLMLYQFRISTSY